MVIYLLLFLALIQNAAMASDGDTLTLASPLSLAALPFKNLTGDAQARTLLDSLLSQEFAISEFELVSADSTDAALRRHRIRDTGQLGWDDAQKLSQDVATPWILLGSMDLFDAGDPVQVGLSARLLDASTGVVVWADCQYASGRKNSGFLGLSRADHPAYLLGRETHSLITSLRRFVAKMPKTSQAPSGSPDQTVVLLAPFDGPASTSSAQQMTNHIAVSLLVKKGFAVLEPGIVAEHLLANEVQYQGQVDYRTLQALADRFGAAYCLTGALTHYESASAAETGLVPEMAISARLLDAENGKVVWAGYATHSGNDYLRLFTWGVIQSPGKLLQKMLTKLTESFAKKIKANGNHQ